MPSPIGHGLGGIAAGWLVMRRQPQDPSLAWKTATFAALGAAADLDLLVGVHRGPTHSIGAAVLAGLVAWAITARRKPDLRFAVAAAVAYGSHVLLDWLGSDPTPPSGVWALWPVSQEYYLAPWQLFLGTSRRFHDHRFWATNLRALVRELAILVPVVALVAYHRSGLRARGRRVSSAVLAASLLGWPAMEVHRLQGGETQRGQIAAPVVRSTDAPACHLAHDPTPALAPASSGAAPA